MQELIAQINYHNQKYYVKTPRRSMIANTICCTSNCSSWKRPSGVDLTRFSLLQRVGGAPLNTFFEKVEHEVPMESLHDSFPEEELMDF